jgi:hypothetical protein
VRARKSKNQKITFRFSVLSTSPLMASVDWATCFPNWHGKQMMLLKNITMPSDDRKRYTGMISSDGTNIWQPARYLDSDRSLAFDKILPLTRRDGSSMRDKIEQAEELLCAFFLPLLATTGHDGNTYSPAPLTCTTDYLQSSKTSPLSSS